jgi:D-3-phosphoglycerate dehydrogenase
LALIRRIPAAFDSVKRGEWDRDSFQGTELHGKSLGIIGGAGRVAKQVAQIAYGFGMFPLGIDIIPLKNKKGGYTYAESLEYILRESDIITVHVPLNSETQGMFGAEQFAMMKPTAYFINTSRGAVVDEEALVHALRGRIAGAALDVLDSEPKIRGLAWAHSQIYKNLIITPHIAGNTTESRQNCQLHIANKIIDYFKE